MNKYPTDEEYKKMSHYERVTIEFDESGKITNLHKQSLLDDGVSPNLFNENIRINVRDVNTFLAKFKVEEDGTLSIGLSPRESDALIFNTFESDHVINGVESAHGMLCKKVFRG